MKKALNSWKIWAVLSALLFFMTCWVFVAYAATASGGWTFAKWKTASGWGELTDDILTASWWNDLMDALDQNAFIPDWAIMAFYADECPEGWKVFTGAIWRFLMWATSNIGTGWWKNYILGSELPAHQHEFYDYITQINASENGEIKIWTHTLGDESVYVDFNYYGSSDDYATKRAQTAGYDRGKQPYIKHKTIKSTTNNSVNITNPYINVLYCVKGDGWNVKYTVTFNYSADKWENVSPSSIVWNINDNIVINNMDVKVGDTTAKASPVFWFKFKWWNHTCWGGVNVNVTVGNWSLLGNCTFTPIFEETMQFTFSYDQNNWDEDYNSELEMEDRSSDCDEYNQTSTEELYMSCRDSRCYSHAIWPDEFQWFGNIYQKLEESSDTWKCGYEAHGLGGGFYSHSGRCTCAKFTD